MCLTAACCSVQRSIHPLIVPGTQTPHFCLVTTRDISAEQRALVAQEDLATELQATLESTADGILVTDLSGRIRAFNRRFAQLWGMPEALLEARRDDAVQAWMRRVCSDPEAYEHRLQALQESTLLTATERLSLLSGQVLERVVAAAVEPRPAARARVVLPRPQRTPGRRRARSTTLSRTDALTGLPNRRQLAEQCARPPPWRCATTATALPCC